MENRVQEGAENEQLNEGIGSERPRSPELEDDAETVVSHVSQILRGVSDLWDDAEMQDNDARSVITSLSVTGNDLWTSYIVDFADSQIDSEENQKSFFQ